MVALGSILGRKICIKPQQKTDWMVTPNLWGAIIGPPGSLKSPAMSEVLKPLKRFDIEAGKAHSMAMKEHGRKLEIYKAQEAEAKKQAIKNKTSLDAITWAIGDEPEAPKARRYIVNDTTYEKLGEILADNPMGTLAVRDELITLVRYLDREEQIAARGFFMQAWNGNDPYTFDRIGRGTIRIDGACLSIFGSTQPSVISSYLRSIHDIEAGSDGFIQRFGLMAWPAIKPEWCNVDRYPDSEAKEAAWGVFNQFDVLGHDPRNMAGARLDKNETVPSLRFDPKAQSVFDEYRADLERKIRSPEMSAMLQGHLSKYRGLIPKLALINHLADGGSGPVTESAVRRAIRFAGYLESHAAFVYRASANDEVQGAKIILAKIRAGDLQDGFTARDVRRHEWSGLVTVEGVQTALDLLVDYGWLIERARKGAGRPTSDYWIHAAAKVA